MNETQHGNNAHGGPHDGRVHSGQGPYWKRAHLDWRMWAGALLLIFLMLAYVMSDNLAWRPRGQPPSPVTGAVGK